VNYTRQRAARSEGARDSSAKGLPCVVASREALERAGIKLVKGQDDGVASGLACLLRQGHADALTIRKNPPTTAFCRNLVRRRRRRRLQLRPVKRGPFDAV
jgi:hypothetical protein